MKKCSNNYYKMNHNFNKIYVDFVFKNIHGLNKYMKKEVFKNRNFKLSLYELKLD